jgi:formylglycine-generating enzyme required for sulfatase activity
MPSDASRASEFEVAGPEVVLVPAGCFVMGSASGRDDEWPPHEVELAAFEIGRTPVANAEYAAFLASGQIAPPPWWGRPGFAAPDQPVVGATWDEAVAFAGWLSEGSGRRWRLPTEAEWERAVRGGLEAAPTAWGDALPAGELPEGKLDGPWLLGRGTPNGFGLMDPGTLVHEWCQDWYAPGYYGAAPRLDPRGPEEGQRRASRGGSWRHRVRWSPPSARSSLPPGFRYADYGFRLVRDLAQAGPATMRLRPDCLA